MIIYYKDLTFLLCLWVETADHLKFKLFAAIASVAGGNGSLAWVDQTFAEKMGFCGFKSDLTAMG